VSLQRLLGLLLKGRGFDLLINDNLIDGALFFGAFICGLINALVGVVLANIVFNVDSWGFWAAIGFLIGIAMGITTLSVIESAVATCFVLFAEDPAALQKSKPDEYNRLTDAFNGRLAALRSRRQYAASNQ